MDDRAIKIYNWIQSRYKHYDKIEGRYSGDKHTKKIFTEAAKLFNTTYEQIESEYYSAIHQIAKHVLDDQYKGDVKTIKKIISKYDKDPNSFKATKLHNKKVKLNVEHILKDSSRSNKKFIDFVKKNKDNIFTAITDKKSSYAYTFKEDSMWLFFEDDLKEVKEVIRCIQVER